ncbi:hypothetical protein [Brevundimonas lenta]|uniref:Uncharacterized protein n=1 Tax=Brevundimonas lenta TaxID=424796 RepID=A0A7W6NNW6_9CAUL|nr:hypothetical protein [Brevundimonas lenta]MBB4082218.1 hypothetical protein [Brevundimonas lenta]
MSSHPKNESSSQRDLWQILAPAPVAIRRRPNYAHPPAERAPGVFRVVVLALIAGVAFTLQVTRLWQLVP